MNKNVKRALVAGIALAAVTPAFAADLPDIPVEPMPPVVVEQPETGGWYIRGDVDYHMHQWNGADYVTYGPPAGTNTFTTGRFDNSWSLGGGIGYKVTRHFRVDATADYFFRTSFNGSTTGTCGAVPCSSTDTSSFAALLLLANAYADLGTYHGITPYVGVGIGGAHVNWGTLRNTIGAVTTDHDGARGWRFAYAATLGASYCLTNALDLDVGYRFSRITGGRMFQLDAGGGAGPGFDRGIDTHEVRVGLRYKLNNRGHGACGEVAYVPEPQPPVVYKE